MTLKTGALLAILGVGIVGTYTFITKVEFFKVSPKSIVAQVQLVNNCPLRESAFRVQDLTTGKITAFSGGNARIKTNTTHYLTLSLAKKYDDVVFSGTPVRATANMKLMADCQTSEKENATFQSLRKSLGGQ
ncbi:hypothetical protein [Lentibacter algarum]|jgi:hypothetical protein|uniref:hypothetical protein n=1 Tax=Lentibacter algarum TaxID=576131 RepID=UPI002491133B|nr:hypothetical protein [Lentibacter algarum]